MSTSLQLHRLMEDDAFERIEFAGPGRAFDGVLGVGVAGIEPEVEDAGGRLVIITPFQDNDNWILPIPATFVVGRDGLVKARFVDPDYRKRMGADELLAALWA